ncbi:ABC transporter ATP-binding protein [Kutzneria viridogrisea]|uniref:Biotin transport system ATP-binding protein n=2 Tax=Kutzneria TaxID=43356 RepID=A0ABR6BNQ8_9PSEU|nr:ABC transporter ATP-binding protein [Kutzneria albida]AHH96267.1 putative ABC transporter ATP-binding protein [Kutzneria albida DSM 43870]MBA8928520.1 biotin transport system ATP-binding protein [Kutzneria viridogrisea]
MIELDGVSHWYGQRQVLADLTLSLGERRVGVVGSNGSGKSTFARLLNGLLVPGEGQVRVDGLDTRKQGKAVRRKVGFVFQDPDVQIVMPTVGEDLAFGLKHRGQDKAEIARRVDAALAQYGLAELREHPAHLLSGGQKQLLAIAAVLITEPTHVIFDEPTTLLDLGNRRRIARLIRDMDQQVVVVSHDLDLLADFDRVLVFDRGRVVADGKPDGCIATYQAMHPPL